MNLNFRSSLHGFNRQDVANYLEYLNNRHAAQVNQLNTDLEACGGRRKPLQKTPSARPWRPGAGSWSSSWKPPGRNGTRPWRKGKRRSKSWPPPGQDREEALLRSCGEKLEANRELEAYRRAERTERMARERAEQVYSETGTVLTQASNRIEAALRQMTGISQQVTGQLDTLQTAIASSRLALQDAAQTIDKLKPSR